MTTTRPDAIIAVANVGHDAIRVAMLTSKRFFNGQMSPAVIEFVAQVYSSQNQVDKATQLRRIASEWAEAKRAAS